MPLPALTQFPCWTQGSPVPRATPPPSSPCEACGGKAENPACWVPLVEQEAAALSTTPPAPPARSLGRWAETGLWWPCCEVGGGSGPLDLEEVEGSHLLFSTSMKQAS